MIPTQAYVQMSPASTVRRPGSLGEAALYYSAECHLLDVGFFACKFFVSHFHISDNLKDSIGQANRGLDPPRLALPQSFLF